MLILKGVESDIVECHSNNISHTKKYIDHIPCSFAYKVVCVDNNLVKNLICIEEKMLLKNLLVQFLVSTIIAQK